MVARRCLPLLGLLFFSLSTAHAQPALSVNGATPPGSVSVSAGATVSVAVSGGPSNTGDWVGLYAVGAGDSAYVAWQYLSGTTAPPATGVSAAVLTFVLPVASGTYEFRFFANNGFGLLASALFARLFIVDVPLHFAERALALHLLLQRLEGLIDVVVADENLNQGSLSFGRSRSAVPTGRGAERQETMSRRLASGN